MEGFLPVTYKEMREAGIKQPDFVYITGDAYADHPSFGAAIVSRLIESLGYSICMLPQPDWHSTKDFMRFGKPRLAFLVTGGNIDSMVAHYTAAKRKRSDDMYSPGGKAGRRPDRAVTVYCRKIREAYPDAAIAIGGLEASLRRFAHYDYWDDAVRPSVLVDSGADLLMYGMGEHQITELCRRLDAGEPISALTDIRGTCYLCDPADTPWGAVQCPDFAQVCADKKAYAKATRQQYDQQDEIYGKTVIQRHGNKMLVQNPPATALSQEELDAVYRLPFTRRVHPMYDSEGGVPGIAEVQFSIAHNRGCFGYCNFCSIALHQGRRVTCRSEESLLEEAKKITAMPNFKGYIHDVGGPTANFRHPSCEKQEKAGMCKGKKCLAPSPCPALKADHREYLGILRKLRALPKVKRVFIRSGIRFDYLLADEDESFFKELVKEHVSGQLKVAPEHCSNAVLDKMGKPHIETYNRFQKRFYEITKSIGKEQYLVPYLMSSHPGSTLQEAVQLALYLRDHHIHPEQVQDFYPTPGTISTCMYYTELDPYTMEPVYVPKTPKEKAMQRALLQYYRPQNRELVLEALRRAGRHDLIGTGPGCLAAPDPAGGNINRKGENGSWKRQSGKASSAGARTHSRHPQKKSKAAQTPNRPTEKSRKSKAKGASRKHGS
ncbi:MAG: YgiQ family radical SAM protein [Ruminococcus sp.]|nr:YgiQ family radical SAM protein [Ruminococcus sp.]